MRIAFLCPYFGKFPNHIQLWLNSCGKNESATFYIFTDDRTSLMYPDNVIVKYMDIEEMRKEWQKKFDFKISLEGAYKIGDYKPAFGYLFEELIEGYDAWGHLDVPDEIIGNIGTFINNTSLDDVEKLMARGHMTIYRNTKEVNRRFMENSGQNFNYKDIFASKDFYNFEETGKGSINWIYKINNYPYDLKNDFVADLSGMYYDFRRSNVGDDFSYYRSSKLPSVYSWENGRVYGYFLTKNGIKKIEYLYVHFKRRKMTLDVSVEESKYLITQTGFKPFQEVDSRYIKMHSKKNIFYNVYWQEKWKGLKRRLNKWV